MTLGQDHINALTIFSRTARAGIMSLPTPTPPFPLTYTQPAAILPAWLSYTLTPTRTVTALYTNTVVLNSQYTAIVGSVTLTLVETQIVQLPLTVVALGGQTFGFPYTTSGPSGNPTVASIIGAPGLVTLPNPVRKFASWLLCHLDSQPDRPARRPLIDSTTASMQVVSATATFGNPSQTFIPTTAASSRASAPAASSSSSSAITSSLIPFATPTAIPSSSSFLSLGTILGIGFGALVAFLILFILLIMYLARRRRHRLQQQRESQMGFYTSRSPAEEWSTFDSPRASTVSLGKRFSLSLAKLFSSPRTVSLEEEREALEAGGRPEMRQRLGKRVSFAAGSGGLDDDESLRREIGRVEGANDSLASLAAADSPETVYLDSPESIQSRRGGFSSRQPRDSSPSRDESRRSDPAQRSRRFVTPVSMTRSDSSGSIIVGGFRDLQNLQRELQILNQWDSDLEEERQDTSEEMPIPSGSRGPDSSRSRRAGDSPRNNRARATVAKDSDTDPILGQCSFALLLDCGLTWVILVSCSSPLESSSGARFNPTTLAFLHLFTATTLPTSERVVCLCC